MLNRASSTITDLPNIMNGGELQTLEPYVSAGGSAPKSKMANPMLAPPRGVSGAGTSNPMFDGGVDVETESDDSDAED